jgi:hypothetical protein
MILQNYRKAGEFLKSRTGHNYLDKIKPIIHEGGVLLFDPRG